MKVLVLSYLFPAPPDGGYKLRVFHTIRELAREHDVDLVCCTGERMADQNLDAMKTVCRQVYYLQKPVFSSVKSLGRYAGNLPTRVPYVLFSSWDQEKIAFVRALIEKERYEVVVAEHLIAGRILHEALRSPLGHGNPLKVLVNHNVESILYRDIALRRSPALAPYHLLRFRALCRYEAMLISAYDLVVAMSDLDRQQMALLAPGVRFIVLPNGVDTSYFTPRHDLPPGQDIYYAGSFGYFPNVDAVEYFMDSIYPAIKPEVPGLGFNVIGANPPQEVLRHDDGEHVRVLGYQDDIRRIPMRCRAAVVPLRLGSGTRLKIVEAMSMGIPVVSTSKGAEGLDVTDGFDIMLADRPDEFARKLTAILRDDSLASRIGSKGRELVEGRYSWSRIVGEFQDVLSQEVSRA